jgi:hypothetical protein
MYNEAPALLRDLPKILRIKSRNRYHGGKLETSSAGMERRYAGLSIVAAGVGVDGNRGNQDLVIAVARENAY